MSTSLERARYDVPQPDRVKRLPRDQRGWPVPWFVEWRDNEPIFPAFDPRKFTLAVRGKRCWVCGDPMGRHQVFVVGPMCTINRVSSEPPSHLECAEYSAKVCPFLANPRMRRVPTTRFGDVLPPGGLMEERNPGLTALWRTRSYSVIPTASGPILQMGEPHGVDWWCRGRPATPYEALDGFDEGAAVLRRRALELDGPEALPTLDKLTMRARKFLPPLPPGASVSARQPDVSPPA